MLVVGIDPGVKQCAIGTITAKELYVLDTYFILSDKASINYFFCHTCCYEEVTVIVEEPDKIQPCVANVQDIFNLVKVVERIQTICWYNNIICKTIPVKEWKGNTKKKITQRRVRKHLKVPDKLNHNIYDALGIALYYIQKRM